MVPTNDYVFKRIFGHVGNEKITIGLISSIIKEKINTIKINENPITEKDMIYDKVGILDLRVRLNDKIICNIEMQVVQQEDIEKRIMFYWGKTYTGEIKKGDKYGVLPKTIVILIANFKLEKLKEIERFHTKWQIREEKDRRNILTDTLEIHIIELPKLIKRLSEEKGDKIGKEDTNSMSIVKPENIGDENMDERDKKLVLWMVFFWNPDALTEKELKENEDIRLAKEELERLKQDEHERYLAELREKHVRDIQSIQDYGIRKRT